MRPAIERIDGAKIVEAGAPQYMAHRHVAGPTWPTVCASGQQFRTISCRGKEGIDELFVQYGTTDPPSVVAPVSGPPRASQKALLPSSRWGGATRRLSAGRSAPCMATRSRRAATRSFPRHAGVDDEAAQFGPGDVVAFEAEQMQAAFCVELRYGRPAR